MRDTTSKGRHILLLGAAATLAACGGSTDAIDAGQTSSGSDGGAHRTGDSGESSKDGNVAPSDDGSGDGSSVATVDGSTAGVECDYHYSGYNSSPSVKATSTSSWSCTATTRSLTANGIPDHDVGTYPNVNCPNTITTQTVAASMTLTPENTGTSTKLEIVGYAFNGVKFDPSTAGTCSIDDAGTSCSLIGDTGNWNIEALGQTSFNFGVDDNNAHVQPTGTYHYHGMPEGILTKLGKGMAMTLVGYALDGFPVYARYGYTNPESATSAIKVMTGSYQLKTTPDSGRPSTATYPMGAFTEDYQYVAGSGDLDECNGRVGVTPEFPGGIYHYYITDTYPYIQRCVKGTPTMPTGGMGGMGGGPPDGGMMGPPGGP